MREVNVRDYSFDLLRFPLSIVILVVHVFSTTGTPLPDNPLFPVFQKIINAFLRGHSVPIFFFISGYVFYLGDKLTLLSYQKKIKKRITTLFVPYIIWNIIALLAIIVTTIAIKGGDVNLTLNNIISCFWNYNGNIVGTNNNLGLPVNGPTWFVRDLMIIVLCTPVLDALLKGVRGGVFLIISFLYYILGAALPFSTALFFFSFGAFISINNKIDVIKKLGLISTIAYLLLGVCLFALNSEKNTVLFNVIKSINIFVGVIFAYNVANRMLLDGYAKPNHFLSSASFFVYISHGIVYGWVLKACFATINPETTFSMFSVYSLSCLIIAIALLVFYYLLNRFLPSIFMILTGGR